MTMGDTDTLCNENQRYSRGQNKVTIAERLYSDYTATLQQSRLEKSLE